MFYNPFCQRSGPAARIIQMKRSDIDMFIMSNKDNLPQEKLPFIKSKLEKMGEDQLDNLSMVSFKSPTTMVIISVFLGSWGIDRFMLGDTGIGIGKLLTLGGCGIWWLIDVCQISKITKEKNWEKLALCI